MVPFLWRAAWKVKDPSFSRSFRCTLSHCTTNRLPERSSRWLDPYKLASAHKMTLFYPHVHSCTHRCPGTSLWSYWRSSDQSLPSEGRRTAWRSASDGWSPPWRWTLRNTGRLLKTFWNVSPPQHMQERKAFPSLCCSHTSLAAFLWCRSRNAQYKQLTITSVGQDVGRQVLKQLNPSRLTDCQLPECFLFSCAVWVLLLLSLCPVSPTASSPFWLVPPVFRLGLVHGGLTVPSAHQMLQASFPDVSRSICSVISGSFSVKCTRVVTVTGWNSPPVAMMICLRLCP